MSGLWRTHRTKLCDPLGILGLGWLFSGDIVLYIVVRGEDILDSKHSRLALDQKRRP